MKQLPFKITCILFVMSIFMTGCKSKRINSTSSQWNYSQFRKEQKSFNSTDGQLKYIDQGKGKVILLLHGIPSSSWLYRKMIPELVQNGYRVITPDMLGFGNSENPKGYNLYNPKEHAKRILELMQSLNIPSWTHVTHDAGGLWTWELLKKSPKSVDKLVLLNTIIYKKGFHPPIKMKEGGFAKFSMWLYKNGITTNVLLKELFKKGLKENILSKNEIKGYKKPLLEGKTRAMYQFFSNSCNNLPDYKQILKNLNIPTLVIWGKHDTMLQWLPQEKEVQKDLNITNENIHLIDAKHFIQEEQPALINSYILDFIK